MVDKSLSVGNFSPDGHPNQYSIFVSEGAVASLDTPCPFGQFKWLCATAGGGIAQFKNLNGETKIAPVFIDGVYYPICGTEIVSGGTTASGLYWLTGL